jgi:hypothetical protein
MAAGLAYVPSHGRYSVLLVPNFIALLPLADEKPVYMRPGVRFTEVVVLVELDP